MNEDQIKQSLIEIGKYFDDKGYSVKIIIEKKQSERAVFKFVENVKQLIKRKRISLLGEIIKK